MTSNQPLLVFNVLLKKKKDQQRLLKLVWMKELEDRIWNFVEIQHSYSKLLQIDIYKKSRDRESLKINVVYVRVF